MPLPEAMYPNAYTETSVIVLLYPIRKRWDGLARGRGTIREVFVFTRRQHDQRNQAHAGTGSTGGRR